ncbi:MAG: hypothetical protein FWD48_09665 [Oscillospiraceae bacterium]|nr:hypothetical protein [Oscillospiraceae bacterium]
MENNNIRKNRAPVVVILICMFLAGAMAAGLLFFMSGGASSYERAERNSLNALFSGASSLFVTDAAESGSIVITPSKELAALTGLDLSELGSLTLSYEMILENSSDIYALLGAEIFGIGASVEFWQIGQEIIAHFPGISDYYILLSGIMGMSGMDALAGYDLDVDFDKIMNEVKIIGEAVLDKYFELTANIESKWSEQVTVGELSKNADVFEIIMDLEFLYELVVVGFEAFLDSDEIYGLAKTLYDISEDPWKEYSWYRSFDEAINEMREELYDVEPWDLEGDEFITMRVYISGNEVVRRDISIEDVTLSFSSITEKNGQYARSARFTSKDWRGNTSVISFRDEGTADKNGYSTGQIRASFADDYDSYSLTIKYEDFKCYSNGLIGGDIKISVPIQEGLNVDINFKSTVTGDSMNAKGSVAVFGMKAVDIEINTNINTGKSISRPALTNNNTIDPSDWRALEKLEEDFERWAEALDLYTLFDDLFYYSGLSSLFPSNYEAVLSPWDDDWYGNYCYECYEIHEEWESCIDWENWCTGDEWCWCNDCYVYECVGEMFCWCDDCVDTWTWEEYEAYWDEYWASFDPCTASSRITCFCEDCFDWDREDWDDIDWDAYSDWAEFVYE